MLLGSFTIHAGTYTLKCQYFEEGGGPANPKKRQKTPKKMLFFAYCEKWVMGTSKIFLEYVTTYLDTPSTKDEKVSTCFKKIFRGGTGLTIFAHFSDFLHFLRRFFVIMLKPYAVNGGIRLISYVYFIFSYLLN